MKKINNNTFVVEGTLYTNMTFSISLLTPCNTCNTIHSRHNVFFEVMKEPKLQKGDYYLDYEKFIKTYGPIRDIIAYSNI